MENFLKSLSKKQDTYLCNQKIKSVILEKYHIEPDTKKGKKIFKTLKEHLTRSK